MTTAGEARTYPFSEARGLELDPTYRALRDEQPVARVRLPYGGEGWLATRYADVKTVMSDPRFSRAATVGKDIPRTTPARQQGTTILSMDPPEHSRLRKLVAKAFTARQIERLRARAQQVVDELLDRMAEQGPPADLVEGLALPLPITMICEMLGVPFDDRDRFRAWSDQLLGVTAFTAEEIEQARAEFRAYLAGLIEQRRRTPSDDMLGVLVQARDEDDKLTEDELVDFGITLLVAGHETTANQIGNFVYTLMANPEQLAKLRDNLDLVPSAVEELLRFIPLGNSAAFARVAVEDVELGGVLVKAGEAVLVSTASANRDAQVFDNPDQIDLERQDNAHVAFGHGVHHCLGAQLARLELQIALKSLLTRFPTLRPAVPIEEMVFKQGRLVRGLSALPVAW
ncbi:cytochrome P450 [Goodfellowiella coeruleoviolacea]|uniref:Cytochrome P450 n=1 Tax=Goodfellowiella coeruleoviolacea TaxID=334858 RepID=A0AAE3KG57_9PSEU|nr:cytochrome P450 [Goodfellowiella coeruleoviolacea]MCP2165124.1 Cytochrome P450 [Goodfellowiella coeruleoviolacea]